MSYLGKTQLKASDIKRFNVTGSTSATHTLTWVAPNEQSLIITINGVKQQEDAYSVSGVTLTLTSALVTADKMEVVGIVDIGQTIVPGTGVILNEHVNASAAIALSKLNVTGTGTSSNFLRGDGSWSTVEGSEITSQNTFFKNPNTVTSSQTTTIASTENAALIGPIGVNSTVVWAIVGTLQIL